MWAQCLHGSAIHTNQMCWEGGRREAVSVLIDADVYNISWPGEIISQGRRPESGTWLQTVLFFPLPVLPGGCIPLCQLPLPGHACLQAWGEDSPARKPAPWCLTKMCAAKDSAAFPSIWGSSCSPPHPLKLTLSSWYSMWGGTLQALTLLWAHGLSPALGYLILWWQVTYQTSCYTLFWLTWRDPGRWPSQRVPPAEGSTVTCQVVLVCLWHFPCPHPTALISPDFPWWISSSGSASGVTGLLLSLKFEPAAPYHVKVVSSSCGKSGARSVPLAVCTLNSVHGKGCQTWWISKCVGIPYPQCFQQNEEGSVAPRTPAFKAQSWWNKICLVFPQLSVQHKLITQGQSETATSLGGYPSELPAVSNT